MRLFLVLLITYKEPSFHHNGIVFGHNNSLLPMETPNKWVILQKYKLKLLPLLYSADGVSLLITK